MLHFVEPRRDSFQVIHEFLTGHQADVADDRVLATLLFTDVVDSARLAADMGDRDWHALLMRMTPWCGRSSLVFAAAK